MRLINSILILFTIILITSCGPTNTVEVNNFSPTGEVEKLTTFTVEFSEPLAPADTIDKWLSDEFIQFEPKIEGKFKWVDARTLIFSPDLPLAPIQEYTANVTTKVLFDSKFAPSFEEYSFNTPDFDVTKVDLFWSRVPNKSYTLSVQANIHFNYPVVPDQLKKYLKIEKAGEEVKDYQIITENSADVIAINFGEIEQSEKTEEFEITVNKGLESVIGKKPLEDTRSFENELPPITRLAITGVSSGFDGESGWITVSTTQMVDEKQLNKFVSIDPPKPMSYFVTDNQFRIEADLTNLTMVTLKIKKGLPGMYGGELETDFEQVVSLVNLKPSINFAEKKAKYLMMSGAKNLQVNIVNVDKAEMEVSQVFKNNLLHFLDRYSYTYYNSWYNTNYQVNNFGRPLYTKKIEVDAGQNWLEKVNLNLRDAITEDYKGIYTVSVRSDEDRWIQDSKMLAISDLGLIAKKGTDQIIVFVNSIGTTDPVANAEVSVISTNNQIILSGKTDQNGVVKFDDISENIKGFTPRLITAELGNDFNYIDLNETNVETSRFDVGGIYEYSPKFNAFIYGDRNIYRPGEKVNISGIVRDEKINTVKDVPAIIKIITPTGKVFEEFKKTLNEQGSFEISFNMPDYAQTGEYIAELYSGTSVLIGAYKFSVEDFVPDKIRVALKSNKEKFEPGEKVEIDVDAEFLFGAKAAGLKYEVNLSLREQPFRSKTYPAFDFSVQTQNSASFENAQMDGKLSDEGKTKIEFRIPNGLQSGGIIRGYAYVSVFDLTGRTVNRVSTFEIYPKNYFVGINAPGYYFGTNDNLKFQFAAVDKNDKPLKSLTASIELVRYEWQTVLRKDYADRYYYTSEKKEIKEWSREADLSGGKKDFTFTVTKSGQYELRAFGPDGNYYVSKKFYAYGWASSTASSFEVDKEGRVDIVFDKEKYEPGEKAKVLFMAPFSGKMLVTFERNGVQDFRYIEMNNKSAELDVTVTEDFMPNIYVTATLFRKHTVDQTTPFLVGHGFASMKVEKKENLLPVSISAPAKIKPRTTQEIVIKTIPQKDVFVTFAAVDEGILQIKNFETPNPYKYMYAKRSLKVDSYDLYELLLPEIVSISSAPGGDAFAAALQKRTNPITTKRFKLLSFWSGMKKTNENGEVKITLPVPQFNGEVRLMAAAYIDKKFGSADKAMKVADDIIIEPEVPRFLTIGDSLVSAVTVINTTDKKGDVTVSLNVEGPLNITSAREQKVNVPANSTAQVKFAIKNSNDIGKGKLTFSTKGLAEVKEVIDIAVRPASSLITESGSGTLKAGQNLKIQIPKDYLAGTQNTTLTLSKFPAVKFAKQLKYLVGYPHGCIEQTVSKVFPQLYFEELAKVVAPEFYRTNNPVYYVNEGIRKIESMQLYDGSMAYWQGGSYSSWWGSVYAAHFLLEAQKAGYNVSQTVLNSLLNYLEKRAKEKSTFDYRTYSGTRYTINKIANKEIIYSLYVLSLAGKGDISTMNYYKSRPHLLSTDTKYLLAGAYGLMGKWSSFNDVLPDLFQPEKTDRLTGGSFDSEARANAIMLNVLIEVEPTHEQIPLMIKHLSGLVGQLYSTQERSFTFLALGKAAKLNSDADVAVTVKSGDEMIGKMNNADVSFTDSELNGAGLSLDAQGKGEVYYFWSTEGVKKNAVVPEKDSFMKVRRSYYDYNSGAQITNNKFKQGQLLVCRLTLTGYERSAENVFISDLVPAGFEIENPRLTQSAQLNWSNPNPIDVQYLDVRDDRLIIFTELKRNKTQDYFYLMRVVNKGEFVLPAVGAEAMYDPEFNSYHGYGKIEVRE